MLCDVVWCVVDETRRYILKWQTPRIALSRKLLRGCASKQGVSNAAESAIQERAVQSSKSRYSKSTDTESSYHHSMRPIQHVGLSYLCLSFRDPVSFPSPITLPSSTFTFDNILASLLQSIELLLHARLHFPHRLLPFSHFRFKSHGRLSLLVAKILESSDD